MRIAASRDATRTHFMKMASSHAGIYLYGSTSPDGAMLFQFLKQPISYHQYTGRKRERMCVE